MRIFFSTGEWSGDIAAARLTAAIRRICPQAVLTGTGGPHMTDSGVQLLTHTNRLGSVGLTEPLATIPGLVRAFVKIRRHILDATPDAAVLIGHDLFNTILARWLQRRRIRCVCFFPPQVWLWRSLAGPIARPYRCMLTVFPEEQQVYEKVGGRAIFVGHYLRDEILPITSEARAAARDRCGFAADDRVVALLPGSRPQEVRQLAHLLLESAAILLRRNDQLRFVLPLAAPEYGPCIRQQVKKRGLAECVTVNEESRLSMQAADLGLISSGTATLEAALLGLPMLIVYRVSLPSLLAVKVLGVSRLIESETIGLPNLLLRRGAAPEFRQGRARPAMIATCAEKLLYDTQARNAMLSDLARIRPLLGEPGVMERAARLVVGG